MAASGLDHLKNDYRRRFCRPSRAPDINTNQNQNMLEILQNCFEEKSLIDDIITNSTKAELYSTPKMKTSCTKSPSKDCQKSHPGSFPISSRKKEASLQGILEPSEAASRSVQAHGIYQKILAADVCSKSTPDLTKNSGKKLSGLCPEADEEFYISVGSPTVLLHEKPSESQNAVSSTQKRETYTFGNSEHTLSSSTEISLKTKKRLNFEDKYILKKVERETNKSEVEDKVSGQQERRRSETSPKRVQDTEYEVQSQAKKSFSKLFLETVKRKGESSPIVRHTAMAPSHLSPPNDTKLLEDEFIIDKSDRSFASQSWITIPRKSRPLKQHTVSSVESTAVLQCEKPREHQSVLPVTLTSDKHLHKAHPEEKSEPLNEKKPSTSCTLTDELESNCRSIKMYSEKAEKPSGNKRTTKKKQKRKLKTSVVEEQPDTGQTKDENMSHIAQDKLPRNSDRITEGCEEMRNGHNAKKEMPPVENMKTKCSTKKDKKESRKKHFSSESKRKKLVPEEMTLTITRSHRVSRRPSDWWMINAEESPVHSNSVRNDILVYHNSRQKPSKKIVKKTILSKRQKTSTQRSSRVQKFLNVKGSGSIIGHDELKAQTSEDTCKTPGESNLDSGESKTSVLEESGPSRLNNYLMSRKNNSAVNNEVQESVDDSRVKGSKVAPRNEVHHKLVLPSNTPNVRRTKRIRSKPLEYWRGERVDYQETPSGGLVIGGILSPETVISKRKAKGNVGKVNKILVLNLDIPLGDPFQPTQVKDPETREIILMDLIRPRDTYQFFVEHGELKVYKTLDTPLFSTGKLVLGPYEEKGKQHVGEDILVFYVNVGDLLCTLHETPYMITTGDSFYVPSGNYYNIKNLLNEESILLFTQIKR
ncbi:centromere protein C [Heterocephalus glaber]|uniref:Centromere protein C n=1 Tax=Heterocephalus glaber TaxID=10181 RepID=A0AAX6TBR8_HETGA|nr:centromere protein C [Heterocephalus glaber]